MKRMGEPPKEFRPAEEREWFQRAGLSMREETGD